MTAVESIIDSLITTEGIHAFVFVSEAADKYLPIIDSLTVLLANGQAVKVTEMDRTVEHKVDETRKTLRREDRIIWALRFYKKALTAQLLWMVQNQPSWFQKRFKSPPAPEQPQLLKALQKLDSVDITPFQEYEDDDTMNSPYSGFSTIEAVNARIGHYLEVNDKLGKSDPTNAINTLVLNRQSFGEVVSDYRRVEIYLRRKQFPGGIQMTPGGKYGLEDAEGPVETIVEFPNGWRWFDLHRKCSEIRNDPTVSSDIAVTGHCANTAARGGVTALELAEPLGNDKWKHHAMFILHGDGSLGEMKGRKNQKPSARLEKYIFELLRQDKRIKKVGRGEEGHMPANNFNLTDLTPIHTQTLKKERPELFSESRFNSNPDNEQI